jgi:hypothetical protein
VANQFASSHGTTLILGELPKPVRLYWCLNDHGVPSHLAASRLGARIAMALIRLSDS